MNIKWEKHLSDENQIGQKYSGTNIKWDLEQGKHLIGQTASGKTMRQKNIDFDKSLVRKILSETNIKWDKYQVGQTSSGTNIQVKQTLSLSKFKLKKQ